MCSRKISRKSRRIRDSEGISNVLLENQPQRQVHKRFREYIIKGRRKSRYVSGDYY